MATIIMDSLKVIEAATNTINKITAERDRRDNNVIDRMIFDTENRLFWFRRYTPTREQAIVLCNTSSDFWGWRSIYAWGTLDHCKKLLKLAQHGDPVTLNEDDIKALF